MAMLTVMGLYDYDNTIFNSLYLPTGVDRQTVIDTIVLETSELECLYPSPAFMKQAVTMWGNTMKPTFDRIWTAINLEYNPIENYDRQETESSTANREHGGKDISQGSTIDSGSLTNKVAGFDSSTLVDHDESVSSATGTDRTELTHGETIEDITSRTSRIHGNIGVTTSQQMLESELDIAPRLNFYRFIAEEFKKRFCILVY